MQTRRLILAALCLCTAAHAQDARNSFSPPPSAQLHYQIRADIRGLSVDGTGQIDWSHEAKQYQLQFETRTPLTGTLLLEKSEGSLDRSGLAPSQFMIKRFRKDPVTVVFDRSSGQLKFAGDVPPRKLDGSEQDRVSVLWQLLSMARAKPATISIGTTLRFFVVGHRGGETWAFQVQEKQRLRTRLGELDTVHLVHQPNDPASAPQVDIWLAPSQEWFPVRIRFSEPGGDTIEQTIDRIARK